MNYDKYPETKIVGFDKDVFSDEKAIAQELSDLNKKTDYCLTVECYPGVNDEVLEMIQNIYDPEIIICSEDIFYE